MIIVCVLLMNSVSKIVSKYLCMCIEETLKGELTLPYNALASSLVNTVLRLSDTTLYTAIVG